MTRTNYDQLRAKLLRILSEAEATAITTKKKLDALEILEIDLIEEAPQLQRAPVEETMEGETEETGTRSLDSEEIVGLLNEAPHTFTHIVIKELAQSKFGLVNGRSIRVGLNKLADKAFSPIEILDVGKGQRPTVFRKRSNSDQS